MYATKNYPVTEKCKVDEEALFCSPSLTWYLIPEGHSSQDMRDKLVGRVLACMGLNHTQPVIPYGTFEPCQK